MIKAKKVNIDITLININPEIYPREKVDAELVETYRLSMEAGIKFPPLVVQKDTYTLIDGLHRKKALEILEKKQVEVEILDIPNTELRAEAVRRNIKHGKRLTTMELRNVIITLRYKDEKTQKEIAEIVGRSEGRVSQICNEYRFRGREFDNFNSKVPKIDLRVKVDADNKWEILNDLKAGLSGKEVAEKYCVSQPTVSQIKKEHEAWTSSPVYIKMAPNRAEELFRIAFVNRLLKKARLEFKEKGVLIMNSDGEKPPFVVAMFKKEYFWDYKVSRPIEGYAESDILRQIKTCRETQIMQDYIELVLLDPNTWKIRYENGKKTQVYDNLDWRKFPMSHFELDADGIPKNVQVKAKVRYYTFPRKQKGQLTLKMENKKLTCSFKCHNDWNCNQTLKLEFLEKEGNATAIVDLQTLDEVLKMFSGPIWIGMWSEQTHLAIGQAWTDTRKKVERVLCNVCFII